MKKECARWRKWRKKWNQNANVWALTGFRYDNYSMHIVDRQMKLQSISQQRHVSAFTCGPCGTSFQIDLIATDFPLYLTKRRIPPMWFGRFISSIFFSLQKWILFFIHQLTTRESPDDVANSEQLEKRASVKRALRYFHSSGKKTGGRILFVCRSCGSLKSSIWYACMMHVNINFGTWFFIQMHVIITIDKNFNILNK